MSHDGVAFDGPVVTIVALGEGSGDALEFPVLQNEERDVTSTESSLYLVHAATFFCL
jgi:hypothetical protein